MIYEKQNDTRETILTRIFQASYLLLCFAFACDDDCPPKADKIYIASGTTNVMLEITSAADQKIIPVYLALPSIQSQPLKAVVVLHGSGGAWDDDDTNGDGIGDICNVGTLSKQNREWETLLLSQGYAIAFPDSYSPRNTCENEGAYKSPPLKFKISGTFVRNHDAQGVLELLKQLTWEDSDAPVIDVNNIALIGFSDGGTALLSTVYDESSTPPGWSWKQSFDGVTYTAEILPPAKKIEPGFKVAIVYYPGAYHNGYYGNLCNTTGIYQSYCDIMFHLAEEDPLTENSECLISTMNRLGGGNAIVHTYDKADHGFDASDGPENTLARSRTVSFLKEKLD